MNRTRLRNGMAAGTAVLAALWLAGFVPFVEHAIRPAATSEAADGIVVLTGGADRIATGLSLLRQGRGRCLLISGVGPGADLADMLRGSGFSPADIAGRIALGRTATSTVGNAEETARWAATHQLRSLLVVTASYHMQRALMEIARQSPGVALRPAPVVPPALRQRIGLPTLRLLAGEYTKLLIAKIGATHAAPPPNSGGLPE